jgi:hypothetical protein
MFDKASRLKLRFTSHKGDLTVEDLWDLPLTSATGKPNLDSIAVDLFNQVKETATVSFVNTPAKADETVQLKLDIAKHIIETRLVENATRNAAAANAEKKQNLLALISKKENEHLEGQSLEELLAMVNNLQ